MKLSKILLSTMLASAIGVQAQNTQNLQNKKDTATVGSQKPKKGKCETPSDSLKNRKDTVPEHSYHYCPGCGRG